MIRSSKYHPRRINRYVPALAYHAAVNHSGPTEVNYGPVAVAAAANILSATNVVNAGSTTTFLQDNTDPIIASVAEEFPNGPGFGRCLVIALSASSTGTVTVRGRDYLGQPMVETFSYAAATSATGVKAFKWIDQISWTAMGGTTTMNVGTTDKLGIPFRVNNIIGEVLDGARVGTLGALVAANLTDPQTATTTDPRGTYDPQSTLNGTAYLSVFFTFNSKLNTSGNGGLFGLAHFFS